LRRAATVAGGHADRQRAFARALPASRLRNHWSFIHIPSAWPHPSGIRESSLMCGIAGFTGTRHIPDEAVQRCLSLMQRRGPDASGYRRFAVRREREALLIHTRLSIIDLDPRSNQPFNVGQLWTAFNGELYNYIELRERLRREGAQLRTQSDTEV